MIRIIVTGGIFLEQILQLHIVTEVNEHGKAFFSAVISKEISQQIVKNKIGEVTILHRCEAENGMDEVVLFAGQVRKFVVKGEGGLYYFTAECISASVEFDKERKRQSYQNTETTYGQLFRQIMGNDRRILVTKDNSKVIPHPFLQYDETDWEFLKRISGYIETVVIPDVCHIYPQISVGVLQGKTYDLHVQDGCEIELDIKQKGVWRSSSSMHNAFSLKIDGELDMNLCDKVIYNGISYVILKKEIQILKGSLSCCCWIGREQSKELGLKFNDNLCGLRLPGIVKAVVGEKLEVSLAIDKEDNIQKLYQYTYLPITGNGMYAMPELGSTVYLYFPDNDEKNAFVVDCLSTGLTKESTTDCRYIKTVQMKSLDLLPIELSLITRKNETKISDKRSVQFVSFKNLSLCARENIVIRSGGLVNLRAKASVHMEYNQGSNHYIHLEGVECTIRTSHFLSSDSGRKAERLNTYDPKMAWKADEAAKRTVVKVIGAIPAPTVEGIGGKVLGGIPVYENIGVDIDISKVAGVKIGGD